MTELYDPMFGPRGATRRTETAAASAASAASESTAGAPISPQSRKPMVRAKAGFGAEEIDVWVDQSSRICVPVLK